MPRDRKYSYNRPRITKPVKDTLASRPKDDALTNARNYDLMDMDTFESPNIEDYGSTDDFKKRISDIFKSFLKGAEYEVAIKAFVEGKNRAEIAKELGMTPGLVSHYDTSVWHKIQGDSKVRNAIASAYNGEYDRETLSNIPTNFDDDYATTPEGEYNILALKAYEEVGKKFGLERMMGHKTFSNFFSEIGFNKEDFINFFVLRYNTLYRSNGSPVKRSAYTKALSSIYSNSLFYKRWKERLMLESKQIIRLTEGDLHRLIVEVVNNVLNQGQEDCRLSWDAMAEIIRLTTGLDINNVDTPTTTTECRIFSKRMLNEGMMPPTHLVPKRDKNGSVVLGDDGKPEYVEELVTPFMYNGKLIDTLDKWLAKHAADVEASKGKKEKAEKPKQNSSNNNVTTDNGDTENVTDDEEDDNLDDIYTNKENPSMRDIYKGLLVDHFSTGIMNGESIKIYNIPIERAKQWLFNALNKLENDKEFNREVYTASWLNFRRLAKNGKLKKTGGAIVTPKEFQKWFGTPREGIDGFNGMMRRGGNGIEDTRNTTEKGAPLDSLKDSTHSEFKSAEIRKGFEKILTKYLGSEKNANDMIEFFTNKKYAIAARTLGRKYQAFRRKIMKLIDVLKNSYEFKEEVFNLIDGVYDRDELKAMHVLGNTRSLEEITRMRNDYKKLIEYAYRVFSDIESRKKMGAEGASLSIPNSLGYTKKEFIDYISKELLPDVFIHDRKNRTFKKRQRLGKIYDKSNFYKKWKNYIRETDIDNEQDN